MFLSVVLCFSKSVWNPFTLGGLPEGQAGRFQLAGRQAQKSVDTFRTPSGLSLQSRRKPERLKDGDSRKEMTPVMCLWRQAWMWAEVSGFPLSLQEGFSIPWCGRSTSWYDLCLFANSSHPVTCQFCLSVQFLDKVTSWLPGPRASLPFLLTLGPSCWVSSHCPSGSSRSSLLSYSSHLIALVWRFRLLTC